MLLIHVTTFGRPNYYQAFGYTATVRLTVQFQLVIAAKYKTVRTMQCRFEI
jgi:predicted N-acetyltransferase YhbS